MKKHSQKPLKDKDYAEILIQQFEQPLQRFVMKPPVAGALGRAFDPVCQGLDTQLLSCAWESLNLTMLL